MKTLRDNDRPTLVLIGGIARSGNHLLRGLLDGVESLAIPPDEDFFVRTLTRSRRNLWDAWCCRPENVVAFYRKMQKDGHFERLNGGQAENSPTRTNLLDLEKYYRRVEQKFKRFSLRSVCEAHFLGLRDAVHRTIGLRDPIRVSACPIVPHTDDFTNICWLLSKYYSVKAIVIFRDPLATYQSGKVRQYFGGLEEFCRSIEMFPQQVRAAKERFQLELLPISFEKLLRETERIMRCVAGFIGIPFEPAMLVSTQNGAVVESNSSFQPTTTVDPQRAEPVRRNGVDNGLSRDEFERLEQRASGFMSAMRSVTAGNSS